MFLFRVLIVLLCLLPKEERTTLPISGVYRAVSVIRTFAWLLLLPLGRVHFTMKWRRSCNLPKSSSRCRTSVSWCSRRAKGPLTRVRAFGFQVSLIVVPVCWSSEQSTIYQAVSRDHAPFDFLSRPPVESLCFLTRKDQLSFWAFPLSTLMFHPRTRPFFPPPYISLTFFWSRTLPPSPEPCVLLYSSLGSFLDVRVVSPLLSA